MGRRLDVVATTTSESWEQDRQSHHAMHSLQAMHDLALYFPVPD